MKTVHHGHTPVIEILGPDRARATWSMEDMLWFPPGGDRHHLWGVGFYFEQYRRDPDGEWRILEMKLRRVRVEVDGVEVFAPDTPPRPDDD